MGGEDGLHLDMAEVAGVTAVKISSSSSSPSSSSSITERIRRNKLFCINGFPWLHHPLPCMLQGNLTEGDGSVQLTSWY